MIFPRLLIVMLCETLGVGIEVGSYRHCPAGFQDRYLDFHRFLSISLPGQPGRELADTQQRSFSATTWLATADLTSSLLASILSSRSA